MGLLSTWLRLLITPKSWWISCCQTQINAFDFFIRYFLDLLDFYRVRILESANLKEVLWFYLVKRRLWWVLLGVFPGFHGVDGTFQGLQCYPALSVQCPASHGHRGVLENPFGILENPFGIREKGRGSLGLGF